MKIDPRKLSSSRSDQLPDGGRTGPCMDDQEEQRRSNGMERSIRILNADLSVRKLSAMMMTLWHGTHAAAKEKGLVRLEGKNMLCRIGDIMLFRFNV